MGCRQVGDEGGREGMFDWVFECEGVLLNGLGVLGQGMGWGGGLGIGMGGSGLWVCFNKRVHLVWYLITRTNVVIF